MKGINMDWQDYGGSDYVFGMFNGTIWAHCA